MRQKILWLVYSIGVLAPAEVEAEPRLEGLDHDLEGEQNLRLTLSERSALVVVIFF